MTVMLVASVDASSDSVCRLNIRGHNDQRETCWPSSTDTVPIHNPHAGSCSFIASGMSGAGVAPSQPFDA